VNDTDKYLRLGVDGPEELAGGFPLKREELFTYRGIILGTVEASAFTPEQQRMLEDFVDVRGGGLLALGGPRSFSEGGWAGTPLSEALPVVLDRAARPPVYPPAELKVKPTRVGANHPVNADHRQGGRRRGEVARPAAGDVSESASRDQAWRHRFFSRAQTSEAASRSFLPRSGTAVARRWCCPCRTRGCGACTPPWT
jgi:hypothetical protein